MTVHRTCVRRIRRLPTHLRIRRLQTRVVRPQAVTKLRWLIVPADGCSPGTYENGAFAGGNVDAGSHPTPTHGRILGPVRPTAGRRQQDSFGVFFALVR